MRVPLFLAALALVVSSCTQGPVQPKASRTVLLVESALLNVNHILHPGLSPDEVMTLVSGPSGIEIDPGTAGGPEFLRIPTVLYGRSALATLVFDAGGLYRVSVELDDLPPVQAEDVREHIETHFTEDASNVQTGWDLDPRGVAMGEESGHMSTGWELLGGGRKTVVLRAGMPDGFAAPPDPTNRNPDIVDYIRTHWLGQDVRDFDEPGNNLAVVHRFTGLPNGPYCSVRLILRLRGQTSTLSGNDSIRLIFPVSGEGTEPFAWWRPIRAFTGTWGVGRDISLEVDLGHLPTDVDGETSILDRITGNVLDVVVEDDTAVDFMMLRIQTAGHPGPGCAAS